jgi:hypothetical protein
MRKKLLVLVVFLCVVVGLAFAQSNDYIDAILAAPQVSASQAAYMLCIASGLLQETDTEADAVQLAKENKWPGFHEDASGLRLDDYSLMLTKAFDYKGGVMYSLTGTSRYAFRELQYIKVIIGRPRPERFISGEECLRYLGNMISWKEM